MKKFAVLAALLLAVITSIAGAEGYLGSGGYATSPGADVLLRGFSTLPDSAYVAEGRQFQLYDTEISVNPFGDYPYTMICDADSGSIAERSFQFTPIGLSTQTVTAKAVLPSGEVLDSKSMGVRAVAKDSGLGYRNLIFVGDSIIGDATGETNIVGQVDSLFALDGGTNVNTAGTQSIGGTYYHEAQTGWTWERFSTGYESAGDSNRFWNFTNAVDPDTRLDFQGYSIGYLNGIPIDAMAIYLGTNDVFGATATGGRMSSADIQVIISRATAFLDTLASAAYGYPDCEVALVLPTSGSAWKSAWGENYPDVDDLDDYLYNMESLRRAYITAFDAGAYSAKVDVVAGNLWVDNLEGYPYTGSAYSARVTDSLDAGTNFIHADADGRSQLADAIYSHLREVLKVETPACTNELLDSWQFSTPAAWSTVATWYTYTDSKDDPFGGTHATAFTNINAVNVRVQQPSAINITADDVVVSAFVKNGNLTGSDSSVIDVSGTIAIGSTSSATVTWATPPTLTLQAGADGGGLYYEGDGWWRLWVYKDLSLIDASDARTRFNPSSSPALGDSVLCAGIQLEYGVTEPCGNYLEKP